MNYRNFGDSAGYPLTTLTHEQYLQIDGRLGSLSPWLAMPGFRLESCWFDFMHCVYLGTGRDLLGSGLKVLVGHGAYADFDSQGDVNKLLAKIHREMKRDCSEHGFLGINFDKCCVGFVLAVSRCPTCAS